MATPPSQQTVLIVEDDAEVREVLAEHLTLHGYEVLEAATGVEALLQLKHARPEAVVLDLNAVRVGGLETLKRIRAFDPETAVIALSEEADAEACWLALELGARDALPKPVVLQDLLATLEDMPPTARTERAEPWAAALGGPGAAPAHRRILIVDENLDVRASLEEFLAERGYQTVAADDETAALEAIGQVPPDIVLLDIRMPGLGGLEALSTIRALAPEAMVILVGAVTEAEIARRALARGAFDYVVKPVDLGYLAESVEAALVMRGLEL
jgi:DNA-binding NtrC family response regulator